MTRVLHWFRRDLRMRDNTALLEAARIATDGVVGVFVISPEEWRAHDEAPVKVDFWLRNLVDLSARLRRLHIPLIIVHADRAADVPGVLVELARRAACDALTLNAEYEVDEARRDARVRRAFEAEGRRVIVCHDRCILPPGSVRTGTGGFYTVFTPFQNRFIEALGATDTAPRGTPKAQRPTDVAATEVPTAVDGFPSTVDPTLWPAGEAAANDRLTRFLEHRSERYREARDIPSVEGTSSLSPYLAAGVISPRQCLRAAMDADGGVIRVGKAHAGDPTGCGTWISELIWREFSIHLTHLMPRVCMGMACKPVDRRIAWRRDEAGFAAWCAGRTGFPIVDAAMRQLSATGWMHNRLRMIAAMFLTKDLLIDWRWGERHFMRHLVDGDLGSNNGGWQWSASTGTDAVPYFRVYNPTAQTKRFDPEGAFVRRWVPELRDAATPGIIDPSVVPAADRARTGYPPPMVDHAMARDRAISAFRAAAGGAPRRGAG